jgi:hypothetical protein
MNPSFFSLFPRPDGTHWSMLIVDVRAFGHIDRADCRQIAYGADAVPGWAQYRWIADDGREFPIAPIDDTLLGKGTRSRISWVRIRC